MKNKNIISSFLFTWALLLVWCSASPSQGVPNWQEGTPSPIPEKVVDVEPVEVATITDIVVDTDGVSILKDIVVHLELTDMLSSSWPYTVFAPTNEAFTSLLEQLDITFEDLLDNKELLATIVQYHVIDGDIRAKDVLEMKDSTSVKTVWGESFILSNSDWVKINESNVIRTDIIASNGVIHLLDTVLLPPTVIDLLAKENDSGSSKDIVATALESGKFPTLIAATQAAWFVDMLIDEWPYTVFAPTEEAFATLLENLDTTAEDLILDTELLKSVVSYHVLPGVY